MLHDIEMIALGWSVNTVLTLVVLGAILRPLSRKFKNHWRAHEKTQEVIADRLDANTPGGLGDIKAELLANPPAPPQEHKR